jgi:hypothetical protein
MTEEPIKKSFTEHATDINYQAVVKLEDKDAEAFIQYDSRELTEKELSTLEESHNLYKKHCR